MRRNGFTTIEMIIVVILIGVIAAIGFPRLRDGLEKQNVRSSKALIATLAATARGAAIQRGCAATLNMTTDSIWVTACGVNPPSANVQVGRATVPAAAAEVEPKPNSIAVSGQAELLKKLRQLVSGADDVGVAFADEARKIHYEEVPQRSIRGQATSDEAEELRDEGIDFMSLPSFLTRDLQ